MAKNAAGDHQTLAKADLRKLTDEFEYDGKDRGGNASHRKLPEDAIMGIAKHFVADMEATNPTLWSIYLFEELYILKTLKFYNEFPFDEQPPVRHALWLEILNQYPSMSYIHEGWLLSAVQTIVQEERIAEKRYRYNPKSEIR